MKITIYGAGAVGCVIGAALFQAGAQVLLVARGKHLEALKKNGLQYTMKEGLKTFPIPVTSPEALPGVQDAVFICVKSYSLPEIAPHIAPLCGAHTRIIPLMNGVPWWFLMGWKGPLANQQLTSLDPQGILEKHIPFAQVIGGITYMASAITGPGQVINLAIPKTVLGEPDGHLSSDVEQLAALFRKVEFPATTSEKIRSDIWLKLCWNIPFNPMSVITGLASGDLVENNETRARMLAIMSEMDMLAEKLEIPLALDKEKHLEVGRRAGKHKPSMLQDYEAGKPLETAAIVDAVIEIAAHLKADIPVILSLKRELAQKEAS